MAYFNRNDRGNRRGGRGFGGSNFGRDRGNRSFEDRDSFERKEMFKTVCDNCGKTCEVPFKPSGDKPVYCSDCFNEQRQSPPRDRGDRGERNFDRQESKPVDNRTNEKILEQLGELNLKIAQLTSAVESLSKYTRAGKIVTQSENKNEESESEEAIPEVEEKTKPVAKTRKAKSAKAE